MSPPATNEQRRSSFHALKWYLLFGALHELAHFAIAAWLGLLEHHQQPISSGSGVIGGVFRWLCQLMIERRWQLSLSTETTHGRIAVVRHAGWVFSVFIATAFYTKEARALKNKHILSSSSPIGSPLNHPAVYAAILTAIEALSTDLFGLEKYILPLFPVGASFGSNHNNAVTFFCGNFGLILLNPAYQSTDTGRKTALDILEKMISVTMVRGAQSGEIVIFLLF